MCAKMCLTITNSEMKIKWNGLKLHIQKNSLPLDTKELTITIMAAMVDHGVTKFPEDSHLVSAVYWFFCDTKYKATKEVTVEIEHCAKAGNASKLSFARADEKFPDKFKQLKGGSFENSSSGILKLSSFCGLCIIQWGSSAERNYVASIFRSHSRQMAVNQEVDFVVTWDLGLHRNVSPLHFISSQLAN